MKNLKLKLLAAKIEFYWWFIKRERQQGNKIMNSGNQHSSPKMLALNRNYSKHCALALKAQREYDELAGIKRTLMVSF